MSKSCFFVFGMLVRAAAIDNHLTFKIAFRLRWISEVSGWSDRFPQPSSTEILLLFGSHARSDCRFRVEGLHRAAPSAALPPDFSARSKDGACLRVRRHYHSGPGLLPIRLPLLYRSHALR